MLQIEVSRIPPEGLEVDDPLTPEVLHLVEDGDVQLREGGRLRCRVDRGDDESVQVRGRFHSPLQLDCGRCLESFDRELDQELDLYYLPRPDQPEDGDQEEEVELSDHDLVVAYYDGDSLDLGEMVREQILLGLPMKRVCREDCQGLCLSCGVNRNSGECQCEAAEAVDPRLSPLRDLLGGGSRS
jgi:uncharacterized protein